MPQKAENACASSWSLYWHSFPFLEWKMLTVFARQTEQALWSKHNELAR